MAQPRFQRARAHRFERYTAGTITLNSTSWANMPGFGTLTLEGQVGDVIEVGLNCNVANEAVAALLDVVSSVSGAPTNSVGTGGAALTSTTGDGIRGWVSAASVTTTVGPPAFYTLQSGDISSGQVTLRLRYRTSSAANKAIYSASDAGIFFYAKNLGPADPE